MNYPNKYRTIRKSHNTGFAMLRQSTTRGRFGEIREALWRRFGVEKAALPGALWGRFGAGKGSVLIALYPAIAELGVTYIIHPPAQLSFCLRPTAN